jgi:8-oxo-dGTP diphosphatase
LIDTDGRLLITGRSKAKIMREMWEFPGGKLGRGESSKDALRRELTEELGIEIRSCDHFYSVEHDYPEMHVVIDFYLVRDWQGTPRGLEGQALQWLRPSDVSPGLLLPADEPVLELLKNM